MDKRFRRTQSRHGRRRVIAVIKPALIILTAAGFVFAGWTFAVRLIDAIAAALEL